MPQPLEWGPLAFLLVARTASEGVVHHGIGTTLRAGNDVLHLEGIQSRHASSRAAIDARASLGGRKFILDGIGLADLLDSRASGLLAFFLEGGELALCLVAHEIGADEFHDDFFWLAEFFLKRSQSA